MSDHTYLLSAGIGTAVFEDTTGHISQRSTLPLGRTFRHRRYCIPLCHSDPCEGILDGRLNKTTTSVVLHWYHYHYHHDNRPPPLSLSSSLSSNRRYYIISRSGRTIFRRSLSSSFSIASYYVASQLIDCLTVFMFTGT